MKKCLIQGNPFECKIGIVTNSGKCQYFGDDELCTFGESSFGKTGVKVCPECGTTTKVGHSRDKHNSAEFVRERYCPSCNWFSETTEIFRH